jgi:hypothetical protein
MQDLRRLLPPELQTASPEEQLNYLKGLVSRNVSSQGHRCVGVSFKLTLPFRLPLSKMADKLLDPLKSDPPPDRDHLKTLLRE